MTRQAKILLIVGGVMAVVAVIIMIAGHVTAGASTSIGFELEGVSSGTITVGEGGGVLGYDLFIDQAEDSNCDTIHAGTTVKDPSGTDITVQNYCSRAGSGWQLENDPVLSPLGHFDCTKDVSTGAITLGAYTVASSNKLWIVDYGEEIGEAVGGIMAAGLVFIVGLIILLVASILCCVACCCMCTSDSPAGQGGQTIGQRT